MAPTFGIWVLRTHCLWEAAVIMANCLVSCLELLYDRANWDFCPFWAEKLLITKVSLACRKTPTKPSCSISGKKLRQAQNRYFSGLLCHEVVFKHEIWKSILTDKISWGVVGWFEFVILFVTSPNMCKGVSVSLLDTKVSLCVQWGTNSLDLLYMVGYGDAGFLGVLSHTHDLSLSPVSTQYGAAYIPPVKTRSNREVLGE